MPAGDPVILEHMKRLGQLARPRPVRRGVFRYRSIEDAKAEKHAASRSTAVTVGASCG